MGKERRLTHCGQEYPVGTSAPRRAKYALSYWGRVRYATTRQAAENAKAGLSYYEQEDATIQKL